MSEEQGFEAAKQVYALYAAFFKRVAGEVGMEKALALHVCANEELGVASAKVLKEMMHDTPFNTRKLDFMFRESHLKVGIDSELVHTNASAAVYKNHQCALYEGYRMGGLDEAAAQALCHTGMPAKLGSMLKQFDPRINYTLKYYRASPDEACTEEITFET